MAVPKRRTSTTKRNKRRAHDALSPPAIAIEPGSGEVHLRHHVSPTGYYRGKKVVKSREE